MIGEVVKKTERSVPQVEDQEQQTFIKGLVKLSIGDILRLYSEGGISVVKHPLYSKETWYVWTELDTAIVRQYDPMTYRYYIYIKYEDSMNPRDKGELVKDEDIPKELYSILIALDDADREEERFKEHLSREKTRRKQREAFRKMGFDL